MASVDPKRKTVFVLGAGFTRAFLPSAPLMVGHYDVHTLAAKFKGWDYASGILEAERRITPGSQINIERLMSRLDGAMPYDSDPARDELRLFLAELKRCLRRKIEEAQTEKPFDKELAQFAAYCVNNEVTCITFNYDDVLDRALWEVARVEGRADPKTYWHPDGGYGFSCRPAVSTVRELANWYMDRTRMLLLKLHGSLNWRPLRGSRAPYRVDELFHDEEWIVPKLSGFRKEYLSEIQAHLEDEPFIVPPVLAKSVLTDQPVLRLVWARAYRELQQAEHVVFIGYSLPRTDIAASYLFSEAMAHYPRVSVVNLPENDQARAAIVDGYRQLFGLMKDEDFDFRGGLEWARELVLPEPTS